MDKAVKSALDKYLGKNPQVSTNRSISLLGVLLIAIVCSTLFSLGVRFNVLGLGVFWESVKAKNIGGRTVAQVVESVKTEIDSIFSIQPISESLHTDAQENETDENISE